MKANSSKLLANNKGFSYIIPLTIVIIAGICLLVIGSFVVGKMSSALEDTYPTNKASGSKDLIYYYNASGNTNATRNIALSDCSASQLNGAVTKFYIFVNGTHRLYYNLSVNGHSANSTSQLLAGKGYNQTLTLLLAHSDVNTTDKYLNFHWDSNNTGCRVQIRVYGNYYVDDDFRSSNENRTVTLLGNITSGFSDIVDVEIVVIIITVLSMAILIVLAAGTRPEF